MAWTRYAIKGRTPKQMPKHVGSLFSHVLSLTCTRGQLICSLDCRSTTADVLYAFSDYLRDTCTSERKGESLVAITQAAHPPSLARTPHLETKRSTQTTISPCPQTALPPEWPSPSLSLGTLSSRLSRRARRCALLRSQAPLFTLPFRISRSLRHPLSSNPSRLNLQQHLGSPTTHSLIDTPLHVRWTTLS